MSQQVTCFAQKLPSFLDSSIRPSTDLAMTEAFEGAEKLLEVWFAPDEHDVPTEIKGGRSNWTGLRQVGKEVWDGMLDEVQCKVLSVIEGKDVDAYLLR